MLKALPQGNVANNVIGGITISGETIDSTNTLGGTNTTGSTAVALTANGPSVGTAIYTWWRIKSADGSTVYIPVWK